MRNFAISSLFRLEQSWYSINSRVVKSASTKVSYLSRGMDISVEKGQVSGKEFRRYGVRLKSVWLAGGAISRITQRAFSRSEAALREHSSKFQRFVNNWILWRPRVCKCHEPAGKSIPPPRTSAGQLVKETPPRETRSPTATSRLKNGARSESFLRRCSPSVGLS